MNNIFSATQLHSFSDQLSSSEILAEPSFREKGERKEDEIWAIVRDVDDEKELGDAIEGMRLKKWHESMGWRILSVMMTNRQASRHQNCDTKLRG